MPRIKTPRQGSVWATSVRKKRERCSLADLILRAVYASASSKGASFTFIKKVIAADGYDVLRNSNRLKSALADLLDKGFLHRLTGSGVVGSFCLGPAGRKRVEGAGRRRRAAGKARGRGAGKRKGDRRAIRKSVKRVKNVANPRGRAEEAASGEEEAEDPAEAAGNPMAQIGNPMAAIGNPMAAVGGFAPAAAEARSVAMWMDK
ncbi:histone H1B-like [Nyctibius grandis]|uniref:histone H1B-like n=1 Tax=Nyctibius grandis TaxID=48427 RepID=UPI0035BBE6B9